MEIVKAFMFRHPVWSSFIAISVVIAGFIGYSIFLAPKESPYETVVAGYEDVIQQVSVTGRVQPTHDASLAFDRSGRIARVYANVGDTVMTGEVLVELDNADALAALAGALATVDAEQAKLDALLRGARPEEVVVKQREVEQASVVLATNQQASLDALRSASTVADDTVRNRTNQMFDNPETSFPNVSFITEYEQQMEDGRVAAGASLKKLDAISERVGLSSDVVSEINEARTAMKQILSFLDVCAKAVNELKMTTGSALSQTTIDAYRTSVATARTNMNTSLAALSSAGSAYSSAAQALTLAQDQLALLTAPPTQDAVNQQKAVLAAAMANVDASRAAFAHTRIRAPFGGMITQMDAKIGQIASVNVPLVALISPHVFKIDAYIPEADIAKVRINHRASTTLDAYGPSKVFETVVTQIDPAETIREGVATYKVTLQFEDTEGLAKPGMTANVDIATGERTNVIAIPSRAVVQQGERRYVRVLQGDGSVLNVDVETGLRGSYGNIEIISGISEGDHVIVYSAL